MARPPSAHDLLEQRRAALEALRAQLQQAIKRAGAAEGLLEQVIRDFVERVNRRAETEMMETGTLEGAHHRAIEAELATIPVEALVQEGEGDEPI